VRVSLNICSTYTYIFVCAKYKFIYILPRFNEKRRLFSLKRGKIYMTAPHTHIFMHTHIYVYYYRSHNINHTMILCLCRCFECASIILSTLAPRTKTLCASLMFGVLQPTLYVSVCIYLYSFVYCFHPLLYWVKRIRHHY